MMGREPGKRIGPIRKDEKENGSGSWCYRLRIAAGLTIAELSKKSGVSVRTIKRIEAGDPGGGYRRSYQLRKFLNTLKECHPDPDGTFGDRKKCRQTSRLRKWWT